MDNLQPTDEPDDIGSDIRAAMESTEAEATPVLSEADNDRARDAAGKFVAKQAEAAAPVAETPAEEPEEEVVKGPVTLTTEKPPSSWKPIAREQWAALPDVVKAEVIRREQDSVNRNHQMMEQYAPLQQIAQGLGGVFQEAQQYGVNPVQHIAGVMDTERALRTAELPQKFDVLLQIADQYGIPLREIINRSVGQEVLKSPQQQQGVNPEIQRQLDEMREWRSNMEYQNVVADVEDYGSQQEFFADVRNIMAELVEKGLAQNLDEAYDRACWMHKDVREVLLARSGQGATQNSVASRQRAAVGVSKAPSKPSVALTTDDPNASIADTVRDAFYGGTGGRV